MTENAIERLVYDWSQTDGEPVPVEAIVQAVKDMQREAQANRPERIVPLNDAGELACECGCTEIQELGYIPRGGVWWWHSGQDVEQKVLSVGGWEWEAAEGAGFSCTRCQAEYDTLPEGWEVEYV